MEVYAKYFLILLLSARSVLSNEDPQLTLNITNEDTDPHFDSNGEQAFSSSTISEKVPDTIGIPNPNNPKSHHHEKHRNVIDNVQSHTRKPVYEVVNQPCYSPGCGGYGSSPQDGYMGNRWQPGRNRYGPQSKYVESRRRGGYGYREFYPPPPPPQPGYGPNYGPQYPDYGYGSRGGPIYAPDRYDRVGGYGRPPYDEYFLG